MKTTFVTLKYSSGVEQASRPIVLNGHWKPDAVKKFISRTKSNGCKVILIKHLENFEVVNQLEILN